MLAAKDPKKLEGGRYRRDGGRRREGGRRDGGRKEGLSWQG